MTSVSLLLNMLGCSSPPEGVQAAVSVAENPDNPFSRVLTVSADAAASVQVAHDMGTTAPQAPGEVLVLGLSADATHTLTVLVDGQAAATVEVSTDPLPLGWEGCEVSGDWQPEEVVCTNGQDADGANYFCVDRAGQPVWSLSHPDGETMLAVRSLPDGGFAAVGDSKSMVALFDERGALTAEITPLDLEGRTRFEHGWIDMHELIAISEGQWAGAIAFLTATGDEVAEGFRIGGGIVVLDPVTLEVLWDWSAHGMLGDDVPLDPALDYSRFGLLGEQPDWLHVNALVHRIRDDGGEEFWVSMRSQDWIVAIDAQTDAIRWRLGRDGDWSGPDEAWFYQQHAPEVSVVDGELRLLVFDNGTRRPEGDGKRSRVVELALDEASRAVSVIGEVDGFFTAGHGDADLLPGRDRLQYVVGWSETPSVEEVRWPDGEALWRMDCPDSDELYRSTFFPSLYERGWWYDVQR